MTMTRFPTLLVLAGDFVACCQSGRETRIVASLVRVE